MEVFGHRGVPTLAPENTFASLKKAREIGVHAETDIRKTECGKLVLFHDDHLSRTTNGTGTIESTKFDHLSRLDAGSWFHPDFKNEKIPLLDDILMDFRKEITANGSSHSRKLDLDLKEGVGDEALALTEKHNVVEHIIFTSFHYDTVKNIKKKSAKAKVGYLVEEASQDHLSGLIKDRFDYYLPHADKITKPLIDTFHDAGLSIIAWCPSNEKIMYDVIAMDVDGIIINAPQDLKPKKQQNTAPSLTLAA